MFSWDIDRVQLAALRKVQRRSGLGVAASAPADGRSRWHAAPFYLKLFLYAVFGITGVAGVLFPSFFLGLVFSYTLIMMIFTLTLLTYFTTVLLDASENRALFHLPISGRTLLAARILCMAKYAGLLALTVSLPTAAALAIRFGVVSLLVFAISLVLTLIFIAAVTLAVCLFVLRYAKPARIRQGISYFQTALIIVTIYAGSAVINANVPLVERLADVPRGTWWYFYPPAWMAGLLEFFLIEKSRFSGVLVAMAVLAPLLGFISCVVLFAGRQFTTLLSRLEVAPRSSAVKPTSSRSWRARLSAQFSASINGDRQQRAVFDLTSKLMRRDLVLNLSTYTFIGVMLFNIGSTVARHHDHLIRDLPLTLAFGFYASYYMPLLLVVLAPRRMQYSPEWRAAWCYEVLPFAKLGVIASGTMKAYLSTYILPVYLLLLVVSAAVWGTVLVLDVLFAAAVVMLVCINRFSSTAGVLPHSRERVSNVTQNEGRASRLAFIPMSVGLIVAHVVLKAVAGSWGVAGGIVAMTGAIIVAYRRLRSISSKDVETGDRHVGWHAT
jgi:ABC-2 type transport system permease protein